MAVGGEEEASAAETTETATTTTATAVTTAATTATATEAEEDKTSEGFRLALQQLLPRLRAGLDSIE